MRRQKTLIEYGIDRTSRLTNLPDLTSAGLPDLSSYSFLFRDSLIQGPESIKGIITLQTTWTQIAG
jgi:hypothetical protein